MNSDASQQTEGNLLGSYDERSRCDTDEAQQLNTSSADASQHRDRQPLGPHGEVLRDQINLNPPLESDVQNHGRSVSLNRNDLQQYGRRVLPGPFRARPTAHAQHSNAVMEPALQQDGRDVPHGPHCRILCAINISCLQHSDPMTEQGYQLGERSVYPRKYGGIYPSHAQYVHPIMDQAYEEHGRGVFPEPYGWECCECKSANEETCKFCGNCGNKRNLTSSCWECCECKSANEETCKFCGNCGNKRNLMASCWECCECKSANEETCKFCGNCGNKRNLTSSYTKHTGYSQHLNSALEPGYQQRERSVSSGPHDTRYAGQSQHISPPVERAYQHHGGSVSPGPYDNRPAGNTQDLNAQMKPGYQHKRSVSPGPHDQNLHHKDGVLDSERRIVLIGKTGCGKSATGNTILDYEAFTSLASGESVTSDCTQRESKRFGKHLLVVDTPGLYATGVKNEEMVKIIGRCIDMSLPGPHAIVLVVSIGRITKEESGTMDLFVEYFGEEMFKFLIILFTRKGDLKGEQTIESYIKSVPDTLKAVLNKCDNRYVAFDNNSGNTSEDVKNLLEKVEKIKCQNNGLHYSNKMYKEAEEKFVKRMEDKRKAEKDKRDKEIEEIKQSVRKEMEKETEAGKAETEKLQELINLIENEMKKNKNEDEKSRYQREMEAMRQKMENSEERERIAKENILLQKEKLIEERKERCRRKTEPVVLRIEGREENNKGLAPHFWDGMFSISKGIKDPFENLFS